MPKKTFFLKMSSLILKCTLHCTNHTPTVEGLMGVAQIGHHNTLDLVNNKYHQEPTYMVFGTQCVDEYKDGLILHMMTTNSIIPTAHVSWH